MLWLSMPRNRTKNNTAAATNTTKEKDFAFQRCWNQLLTDTGIPSTIMEPLKQKAESEVLKGNVTFPDGTINTMNEAVGAVILYVVTYYNKMPEDIKNLVFSLAENTETAGKVADEIIRNFNNVPVDVT